MTSFLLYMAAFPVAAILAFLTQPVALILWTLMSLFALMPFCATRRIILLCVVAAFIYLIFLLVRPPAPEFFMLLVLVLSPATQMQGDGRPSGFSLVGVVFPSFCALVLANNIFLFVLLLVSVIFYAGILTLRLNNMPLSNLSVRLWPIIFTLSGALFFTIASFILMPRISPTQLPGFNNDIGETGLRREMDIGRFSKVLENTDPVFRAIMPANIENPLPENQLYWRVYSLSKMQGTKWVAGGGRFLPFRGHAFSKPIKADTRAIIYEIRHIAQQPDYFPVLGMAYGAPNDARLVLNWQGEILLPTQNKTLPQTAKLRSFMGNGFFANMVQNTQIDGQPRLAAWARQLYARSRNNHEFAQNLIQHFSNAGFSYSLSPPNLNTPDKMRIDSFFFDSKIGYCSHFAASMAVAFRAVGIAANIVLGFSGGEWNPYGQYYLVRRSDAHAWVEAELRPGVWYRFDPTRAVPEARLALSQQANRWTTSQKKGLAGALRRGWQRADAFIVRLNNDIILYDKAARREFLSGNFWQRLVSFGLFWMFGTLAFAVVFGAAFFAVVFVPGLIMWWWARRCVLAALDRSFARLARRYGLVRHANEGRLAFAQRWRKIDLHAGAAVEEFAQKWCRAFFAGAYSRAQKQELKALMRYIRRQH